MLSVHEVLQRRYRIVRLIGKGSTSAIYEAVDESFSEPVAVKEVCYEPTNSVDPDRLDRLRDAFKRQAKSLAKARHPAVPYVRDYFLDGDRQILVSDLVEGDDLGRLMAVRGKPFPFVDVMGWTDQLLDALNHLHNLTPPVIHGDIKPKNLKLTPTGQLKLLDFAIANTADRTAFSAQSSNTDFSPLNYLSFEQIVHVLDPTFREFILDRHKSKANHVLQQNCDARSDIYMVGATIYYLLSCRPVTDIVQRAIQTWEGNRDPLPSLSDQNSEIPLTVSECIIKALAIDQGARFASASEMRIGLKEAVGRSLQKTNGKGLAAVAAVAVGSFRRKPIHADSSASPGAHNLVPEQDWRSPLATKSGAAALSPAGTLPIKEKGTDTSGSSEFESEQTDKAQDTDTREPQAVEIVPTLPHHRLRSQLMTGVGVLALVGAALVWLLGIGRPPTGVAAEDPTVEQTETVPATGSQAEESIPADPPAAQSETLQLPPPQDYGPAAATADIGSELSDEEQPAPAKQVKALKRSVEPRRTVKPNAVSNFAPLKQTQEKKKITVDDLINDN